jgi:hypothetical protein
VVLAGPGSHLYVTDSYYVTRDGADFSINGQTAVVGYRDTNSCFGCGEPMTATIDVNLARKFRTVKARLGLDDRSRADQEIRFEIFADEKMIYSRSFVLGQSEDVALDVTSVLRLRFAFIGKLGLEKVIAAVGDPTAYP